MVSPGSDAHRLGTVYTLSPNWGALVGHFSYKINQDTGEQWLETSLRGKLLLNTAILNKDTAFTDEERQQFGLQGKLPMQVETLEQQVDRAYRQFTRYTNDLSKNIYLTSLRDRNETLFYNLLSRHIAEMLPVIYTPIVGTAVKEFCNEFRSPRGLYISYEDKGQIREMLRNRTHPDVDLIVATDGGGVLGIGDQGVGAMDIPIAKLMVYTTFGGVHPSRTLPIMLDVGTDNERLLNDPLYLGWRHPRVTQQQFDEFVEEFLEAIAAEFPHCLVHWEDLGQVNAWNVLNKYQDQHCIFNDDIQGTGAVTIAAIAAACKGLEQPLTDQRIVVFGAGTAGMGIVEQIDDAMQRAGLSAEATKANFWLIDRQGLLTSETEGTTAAQQPYLRDASACQDWARNAQGAIELLEVIKQVKPTILIGSSAVAKAFTKEVVTTMAEHVQRPIIMPLSNPTDRAEAHPQDLLQWTDGQAVVATGSPFMGIAFKDEFRDIAQSNNALAFPGIGLGVLAAKASRCTENMLAAASRAISEQAPIHKDSYANCLPSLAMAYNLSEHIAIAVAEQARIDGVATVSDEISMAERVANNRWQPQYLPLRAV